MYDEMVYSATGSYREMREARKNFEKALKVWAERYVRLSKAQVALYRDMEDAIARDFGDE
jgi:hypothetical protein